MIRVLGTVFAALLGLAFGSFLNVCLSRWPEGESVVKPRSHCRTCARTLAWWENVPLLSWLSLRGRCRGCGTWIGMRYPVVEAAVGALWAIQAWRLLPELLDSSLSTSFIYYELARTICTSLLLWLMVALAVLDAENLWLPDWLTLPGIALGSVLFALRLVFLAKVNSLTGIPSTDSAGHVRFGLTWVAVEWLLGIIVAAVLILLIRWAYWLIRKQEGLGLGDAKLMALLAAWLGLPGAMLAFGLGVVLGAATALVLLAIPAARRGQESWSMSKLPLGTFLCVGGVVSALWGDPIIAAYLRWAGL